MKRLGQLFAAASLLLIAACGSQTDNPVPAPVGPGIISPYQCAAGQIYTTVGCLPQDPRCNVSQGFNAATGQCVDGANIGGVQTVQRYSGQLSIVDRRQFEWYLNDVSLLAGSYQPAAFCENYGNVYGGNPCSYYSSEGGIQIINQGGVGVSGQYGVQIAPLRQHPWGLTTPVLPMRLFPTNDGQGFALQQNNGFSLTQVVGRGPFGSASGIEVEVSYKNVVFGRGTIYPR